jgi:hypothetical protein
VLDVTVVIAVGSAIVITLVTEQGLASVTTIV